MKQLAGEKREYGGVEEPESASKILKVSDSCALPRPTTTTNTQEIIDDGKDIQISVQPLVPGSSIDSADAMGTLSGSSSNDKKVKGEDPETVHTSSSQPPMSLTSKGRTKNNSPTVATSPQSCTAPPLKIGGVGGFSSAVIGNAKSNVFSSLAGLHEDKKWIGNLESSTASSGKELWGGLTQLTSSSELGNTPISVGEKEIKGFVDPNEVITGEEDENCLLQARARLYQLLDRRTSIKREGTDSVVVPATPKEMHSTNEEGSKQPNASPCTKDEDDTKGVAGEEVENVVELSTKCDIQGSGGKGVKEISPAQQPSEWVEVGTGPVKILQRKDNRATRVVMRRESHPGGVGTKVILNERLHGHAFLKRQAENALLLTLPCAEPGKPTTYLMRCKHSDEVDKLLSVIQECITQQEAVTH